LAYLIRRLTTTGLAPPLTVNPTARLLVLLVLLLLLLRGSYSMSRPGHHHLSSGHGTARHGMA